jgi:hypothetical protein
LVEKRKSLFLKLTITGSAVARCFPCFEKTLNKEIKWEDFKNVPEIVLLTEKIYQFIREY